MIVSLIVAHGKKREIGKDNALLWKISGDLKNFKKITLGKTLLMGRKTYESIGRPLPGRETIVMTRQKDWDLPCCAVVTSVQEAIDVAKNRGDEELIICGGAQVYEQAMDYVERIYLSEIDQEYPEADVYFPPFDLSKWKRDEVDIYPALAGAPPWSFCVLHRPNK